MELLRALAALAEPPADGHARLARSVGLPGVPDAADYTGTFTTQLYPYASVYLGAEGMLGGEARERIAGFWRALGLSPPPEPDHLTTLLSLYAELAERAGASDSRARLAFGHAQRVLLWEHVLPWMGPYACKMQAVACDTYGAWATLLLAVLAAEAERMGPEPELCVHLRVADMIDDPRACGAQPFVATLLAPARSGLIIVRADLARAAGELRLGLRAGERRFALTALLAQDRAALLGWLEREANAQAAGYKRSTLPSAIAAHWSRRARATGELLGALHAQAEEEELAVS